MPLLGRDDDIGDIGFDGHQRSGFDIIVATVGDKIFYRGSGRWKQLDLVEDDERFAGMQLYIEIRRQVGEKGVEVTQKIVEQAANVLVDLIEVYQNV